MSQYRHDPLHDRWVIVGSQRCERPQEFVEQIVRRSVEPCPFCAGNEASTPPPIVVFPDAAAQRWLVRVVPNKYPAVEPSPGPNGQPSENSLFAARPAVGQHEVIIESPRHVASLSELTPEECRLVFAAYQQRLQALGKSGLAYVQIFKNVGAAAGASIEHSHSQLLALPHVPIHVKDELENCRRYHEQQGRPLLAAMLQEELSRGERIVSQTPGLAAFCPWASRFPYEVWIVPRRRRPSFSDVPPGEVGEVAQLMQELVGRIERALGPVGYNYLLHSQPFDTGRYDHYHWHIELFPRITKVAGFEWSTGVFINQVAPEAAAAELRAAAR